MISISDFIALIRKYKKIVLFLFLSVVLLFVAGQIHTWYEDRLKEQYQEGVLNTDRKWSLVMEANRKDREVFKAQKQAETDALAAELEKERVKYADLEKLSGSKQNYYAQTQEGKQKCLDDSFVDIYNDSLGVEK